MNHQHSQKYPYFPPADNQVEFYEHSTLKINPTGGQKMAKICPRCLYPIHNRVYVKPCMHYLCYECYSSNLKQCEYCGMVICEVVYVDDNQVMHTCDTQCYKVFDSESELEKHLEEHKLLKNAEGNI